MEEPRPVHKAKEIDFERPRDGERDEAGIGWRGLVRADWRCCLGVGLVAEEGGSDGPDPRCPGGDGRIRPPAR